MIASAGTKIEDQEKAIEVQGIIDDSQFWNNIRR
jgi:hypothetical protein